MSKPRMPRPASTAMGKMGGISLGNARVEVAGAGIGRSIKLSLSLISSYCGGKVKVGKGRFALPALFWAEGNLAGASTN